MTTVESSARVGEHGQSVEVLIEERPAFIGSPTEQAICNLLWDSFLNVRGEAGSQVRSSEQADHREFQRFCRACGARL